jgi:hypothetical protein
LKCSKEIFGEKSIYFDIKQKMLSKTGIGSIPDGYVIDFTNPAHPQWYIVEIELSSHPIYDHIVKQLNKFMSGIKNISSQRDIVDAIYEEIVEHPSIEGTIKELSGRIDIYPMLVDIISRTPKIVIVLERKSEEVKELVQILK